WHEWRTLIRLHPDDDDQQRMAIEDYLAGRAAAYDGEWRVRHADGAYRWVRIRGLCVRDKIGRAVRMAGSGIDIDGRKSAEDARRVPERRYERAIVAADAGFWDWNCATGQIYVSPRLLEMFGLPPETKYASRSDSIRSTPYHPDDMARWLAATEEVFAGNGDRVAMELRLIVLGETRWVHSQGICTRGEDGTAVSWTGSVMDITERKLAEQEIVRVRDLYAALSETNRAIIHIREPRALFEEACRV